MKKKIKNVFTNIAFYALAVLGLAFTLTVLTSPIWLHYVLTNEPPLWIAFLLK